MRCGPSSRPMSFGWHDLTRRVISSDAGPRAWPYRPMLLGAGSGGRALSRCVLRIEIRSRGLERCAPYRAERVPGSTSPLSSPAPSPRALSKRAIKHYKRNIDMENSAHCDIYRVRLAKMEDGGQMAFKLEPDAVCRKLVHALEAKRPKTRYYVTFPTYAGAFLRRVLPPVRSILSRRRTKVAGLAPVGARSQPPRAGAPGGLFGIRTSLDFAVRRGARRDRSGLRPVQHAPGRKSQSQPEIDARARDFAARRPSRCHGDCLSSWNASLKCEGLTPSWAGLRWFLHRGVCVRRALMPGRNGQAQQDLHANWR